MKSFLKSSDFGRITWEVFIFWVIIVVLPNFADISSFVRLAPTPSQFQLFLVGWILEPFAQTFCFGIGMFTCLLLLIRYLAEESKKEKDKEASNAD